MKKQEVVTFGETMVLFQPNDMLPLEYVHQFQKQIGGAESNVAIGLQRLGHSVGWFSKLGKDPFGRYIVKCIRGEGVDVSACLYTEQASTGVFFKEKRSPENIHVYYYRKDSAASLLTPDDIDPDYIANAKILHVTGITPALSESSKEAVFEAMEIAKQNGVRIVFDPNLRLKLWEKEEARKTFWEMIEYADVVLPGLDEAAFITGKESPEECSEAIIGDTDKIVIIKLGSQGAYYQRSKEKGYVKGFPVQNIVDPVGAGDGFAAGVISGLLKELPLEENVKRANAIGAMVVCVNGDVEGLPVNEEIEAFMNIDEHSRDVNR